MNRKVFAAIAAVVMFALALVLPVPETQLPFGLSPAPMAAGFILLGYVFKDVMASFHKMGVLPHLLVLAVSAAAFVIGAIVIEGQELVAMFVCDYGNPVRFFCNAISGCFMAMALSSLIAKIPEKVLGGVFRRVLSWIGRSTMGIYLIHVPITRFFIAPTLESTLGLARMSLAGGLVSGVLGLAISCALMAVIERYIPQLFGKKLGKVYQ